VVGRAAALLSPRVTAFLAVFAVVVAWFEVAPHIPYIGHTWNVLLVAFLVMPVTMLLVLIALPLWSWRRLWVAVIALAGLALLLTVVDAPLSANFAKFFAAVCAGWAFLALFEALSWVVLVALVIPFVDIISVWRGPTHAITSKHFHVYLDVAVAFLVPAGGAAYLGPPDILFYALFLAAAARWNLRVGWTWVATTALYALTVIIANVAHVGGLPALPFLSVGFFLANGDLIWKRLRAGNRSPVA
jgi:hypothetical protein